jgi:hypothetical protein
MIQAIAGFIRDNSPQFPIVKAPVQAFEALEFLHGRFGQLPAPFSCTPCHRRGEKAQHPLLFKAAFELANRVRMVMRLGRPLCGGALVQQDGPNELITALHGIVKV